MSAATAKLRGVIAVLAVAGAIVSSVSLQHHYAKSATAYCDFGENFNCDIVNRSVYSSLFGIPVALIGMVGYLALLGLATVWGKREETPRMLLLASLAGLGFALYLTYIEGFVLATWCILCLTSLTLILTIAVLSGVMVRLSNRAEGREA